MTEKRLLSIRSDSMSARQQMSATIDCVPVTLSDGTTVYAGAEGAAAFRLADGLIHRPLWTILTMAGSLWVAIEVVRWAERQDREYRVAHKRAATKRRKRVDAVWKKPSSMASS